MGETPTLTLTKTTISKHNTGSFLTNTNTDPSLASFDESYVDAYSHTFLITKLLLDERPGALAQMVEMSYPGHNLGGQPPLSAAVVDAAEDLQRAADESTTAVSWVGRGDGEW
ncbi:hypothetical protein Q7P36_003811 [Cladosporium allicinum]